MSWGAVGSAAVGVVGGALSSGGGQSSIHAMDAIPRFLRDDYERLAGSVEGLATPEYYQGQQIAGMNPWLAGSLGNMAGWGSGMGGDMMSAMYGGGMRGLNGIGMGMNYLSQLQQQGPNQFQYDQGTYDQVFGNLSGGLQNAFDLGAQQMQQNFDWNMLPGLNMSGALGGQQGSTKQYQQGALGQAMANQNIANFGSSLWQNAANQANSAAMQGGMQNLQSANSMQGDILRGYGNFGQLGASMLGQGFDMGLQNMNTALAAGQMQQGYDQSLIDADMAKWNFEQQAPWVALQTQLGMLPGPGGVSPGVPGMSPWEGAMNGAMMGMGVYNAGQGAGWWGGGNGPPSQHSNNMNGMTGLDINWDFWG